MTPIDRISYTEKQRRRTACRKPLESHQVRGVLASEGLVHNLPKKPLREPVVLIFSSGSPVGISLIGALLGGAAIRRKRQHPLD